MRSNAWLDGSAPRCTLAALLLAASAGTGGAQARAEFSPLFDGTLGLATIENGGAFTIEGGTLTADGPEGWLRFPGLHRLRVELRFLTDDADSGVFFRALPDGAFARG